MDIQTKYFPEFYVLADPEPNNVFYTNLLAYDGPREEKIKIDEKMYKIKKLKSNKSPRGCLADLWTATIDSRFPMD